MNLSSSVLRFSQTEHAHFGPLMWPAISSSSSVVSRKSTRVNSKVHFSLPSSFGQLPSLKWLESPVPLDFWELHWLLWVANLDVGEVVEPTYTSWHPQFGIQPIWFCLGERNHGPNGRECQFWSQSGRIWYSQLVSCDYINHSVPPWCIFGNWNQISHKTYLSKHHKNIAFTNMNLYIMFLF